MALLADGSIAQHALAQFPGVFVPPPPIRSAYKNIFARQLLYSITSLAGQLPPSRTSPDVKVRINEPANLFLTINQLPTEPVGLTIYRPDDSVYYVEPGMFVYAAVVFSQPYVIYTTAVDELDQVGWWLVSYTIHSGLSDPFSFYIWP